MRKTALLADYGTHTALLTLSSNPLVIANDRQNVINDYRKNGYSAEHLLSGSVVLRKQLRSIPAFLQLPWKRKDEQQMIPQWHVVIIREETRGGFNES